MCNTILNIRIGRQEDVSELRTNNKIGGLEWKYKEENFVRCREH